MRIKILLRKIGLLSSLLFLLLLTGPLALAQTSVVSGVAKDRTGQVMAGINVIVKGTTRGTTTDANGKFSIEAGAGDVLIMSFIGFKSQQFPVGNRTTFEVEMEEDVALLDEVVVSYGYGLTKKSDLTSAQTTIGAKEIDRTVNTTFEQALQGRSAGVYVTQNSGQPGGGISVNIRGVSTINGSNEPLYVIDGIQVQGSTAAYGAQSSSNPLSGINPTDIQTMDVLQGPSATALYGSRGTNGVIVITTKRGKNGETKLNYTFQNSLQTTPKHLAVMDLPQYAQMVKDVHEVLGGTTQPEFLDPSLLGKGTDWQKELFKTAAMNKHQLSLSGGTDKATYYMSGEYMKQDGIALGSGFKRYSFRANLDNKVKDWLSIGANFSFNQTNEKLTASQESIITNGLQLTPQVPVKNIDGSWGGADAINGATVFAPVNPVAIANLTTNTQARRQFLGGVNIAINIIKGLTFRSSFNANLGFGSSTYYIPTYSIGWAKNVSASLTDGTSSNTYWNFNQQLDYTKQFGKHNLAVMVLHEAQESTWKNTSATRTGFLTNDIFDLNAGDPKTASNSGGSGPWAMESYLGRLNYNYDQRYIVMGTIRTDGSAYFGSNNRWGMFPSVSAAWRVSQEEFFKVPAISDLKLRFETGITGSQGWGSGIYSPMNTGATPTGTGFLPAKYSNSNLKWEETQTFNYGINLGLLRNAIQIEFDYFIKNTDNLLMDNPLPWYMGTNGTGSVASPLVNIGSLQNKGFGLSINTTNISSGDFKWETNLNLSSFKTTIKSFYSATAFVDRISWWMSNWTQRAAVGESPWLFRGYVNEGLFKTVAEVESSATPVDNNGDKLPVDQTNNGIWIGDVKYKDINGDGKITGDDITNIGNPWPKLYAGFTNTFSYKGFDLSILLTATSGNDVYNYLAFSNTNPNNINISHNIMVHAMEYARPTTDVNGEAVLANPNTDVARLSYGPNNNFSTITSKFVEDGSYIRVKNITLGYRLPQILMDKQKVIRGARVMIGVQNIATLTHYKGYDPEVGAYVDRNSSPTSQSIGVDYGRYPLTPIYTFTLGVDF